MSIQNLEFKQNLDQKFKDLKTYQQNINQSSFKNFFLPQHSSKYRITINTFLTCFFSAYMGLGVALHDMPNQRFKFLAKYTFGGLVLGFSYFSLNEIFRGVIIRNFKKEQYFYSHAMSTLVVLLFYTYFRTNLKQSYLIAWKYIGTLSCGGMFMEIQTKLLRDQYLNKDELEIIKIQDAKPMKAYHKEMNDYFEKEKLIKEQQYKNEKMNQQQQVQK